MWSHVRVVVIVAVNDPPLTPDPHPGPPYSETPDLVISLVIGIIVHVPDPFQFNSPLKTMPEINSLNKCFCRDGHRT